MLFLVCLRACPRCVRNMPCQDHGEVVEPDLDFPEDVAHREACYPGGCVTEFDALGEEGRAAVHAMEYELRLALRFRGQAGLLLEFDVLEAEAGQDVEEPAADNIGQAIVEQASQQKCATLRMCGRTASNSGL